MIIKTITHLGRIYILVDNARIGDDASSSKYGDAFVEYLLKDKKTTSFSERDRFLFHDH